MRFADLAIALNYGQGTGSAQMLRWVTEHTEVRFELYSLLGFFLLENRLSITHHTRTGPVC